MTQLNFPPHSNGEVAASYADGGVRSTRRVAHDPSVADYRATSPFEWRGKLLILLAFLLTATTAFAQGRIEGSAVNVDGGAIAGRWAANAYVRAYLGVPFAAPPVGDLRWKPPQPVTPWQGVRDATQFGPQCLQPKATPGSVYYEYSGGDLPMDEDCLTVNVWTPVDTEGDAPVMVWIYGGGFQVGAASRPVFNGTRLAERGAVVVTINYRVGVLGFLAHPELSAESGQRASGNYGLLDQVAALQWVKRNIRGFGGNPDNVTIFGQSAGATSVVHLMASPLARGLFHRAVAESTALPMKMPSLADAEAQGKSFADKLGAASLGELRAKPGQAILDARTPAGPIVDGWFLTADTFSQFRVGNEAPVPFLTGWNRNEGATFPHASSLAAHRKAVEDRFGKDAERVFKLYPAWDDIGARQASKNVFRDSTFAWGTWTSARLHAGNGHPTWVYFFDHAQPIAAGQKYIEIDSPDGLGAFHSSEYPYIFGTLDVLSRQWTATDRALSFRLQSYWLSFALAGDPNNSLDQPFWPRFQGIGAVTMQLGDTTGPDVLPHLDTLTFFDDWMLRTP
jgi:para-nitrobenzyl esterase